ncbi:MAG: HAMP domain-containing methyl-accepting chemotaxis protein [Phycisphaerales bacterium]|nr:HAMP domain-containing methyl-accepting chemotaxis protein [Phycisphaerales bacterium]
MLRFADLKIRSKLFVLGAAFMVGVFALGTLLYTTIQTTKVGGPLHAEINLSKDLIADILPPPAYIVEPYLKLEQLSSETDPKRVATLKSEYEQGKKDYAARHAFWTENMKHPGIRDEMLRASHEKVQAFFTAADSQFFPALNSGDQAKAAGICRTVLSPLFEEHRASVTRVVEMANGFAADIEKNAAAESNRRLTIVGIAACVMICGLFVMFLIIARGVGGPIGLINARVADLCSGKGDLTKRMGIIRKDEVGQLSAQLDKFLDNLQSIMREVAQASGEVASASTQIAASSEEMSATIVQITRQTGEAASCARQSEQDAGQGGEVVGTTVKTMGSINDAVLAGSQSVAELGSQSEQIGRIIGVINEIADQTNLLALNAAIEAARAGEHGRGFAVVADEVRKLAERTTRSTEEVHQAISLIQTNTKTAVDRMQVGTSKLQQGVTSAKLAGERLASIVQGAGSVATMIGEIAQAAEQAGQGSSQAAQAASSLSEKAEQLRDIVGRFRLN